MPVKTEPTLWEYIRDGISAKISNVIVTVNGEKMILPIVETKHVTGEKRNSVQVYAYLDETDASGTITEAYLVDREGVALLTSETQITSAGTGVLLLFEITFNVEVRS
ncbi:hypothetical protein P4V64_10115 [Bacillus thuringiensis]|nr:hypothetical protein [Bacillus thuringiensis]